jgi:hypothetical protein
MLSRGAFYIKHVMSINKGSLDKVSNDMYSDQTVRKAYYV